MDSTDRDDRQSSTITSLSELVREWWAGRLAHPVAQGEVIARRREECSLSARYLLMTTMSAGIAILGLLLSSPAVVIGAMLLSPLMGPIIGLGFAIAIGDFRWMRQSARTLAVGAGFAIVFCVLVVVMSPLQTVTSEIAARTQPNLFDLLIALFSAIAGAYAMIRGREGTIVGVAIATALMPPLAVVGFGVATLNWTVTSGALLLFITNLMTIALTATAMARLYGFRTSLSQKQTHYQTALILIAFVALAVPLGLSLRQIAWEANAQRQINSEVLDVFDGRARMSQIQTDLRSNPIQVSATVLTPQVNPRAERIIARAMSERLGEPVEVSLTQYRVGTGAQAAEEEQLRRAAADEEADAARADALAARLAMVAGVDPDDVTLDRARRRAVVTARPLDGATLRGYRELERRATAGAPEGWDLRLVPPPLPLPGVRVTAAAKEGDDPVLDTADRQAVALIAWAAHRSTVPVRLSGPRDAVAFVAAQLQERGVTGIDSAARGGGFGTVSAEWAVPE